MDWPIFIVDAFTERPFSGNPAAVCLLPPGAGACLDDSSFRAIAAEMNLSETAFVEPLDAGAATASAATITSKITIQVLCADERNASDGIKPRHEVCLG